MANWKCIRTERGVQMGKKNNGPLPWEKFPYHGVYTLPPGVSEWVFPSAFRVVTGEIKIRQYKDEAENEMPVYVVNVKGTNMEGRIEIRMTQTWAKAESREKALKFARILFRNMVNGGSDENRVKIINEKHVRGTSFTLEELRG